MNADYREERDSMGAMRVPANAYYGAQTARAVENFPISRLRLQRPFVRAIGLIKKHAAAVNGSLGLIPGRISEAIERAAEEVAAGKWDDEFVVDVFQTGSGTSTNMNANEVIANRASELLGGKRGDRVVHPNDHVNRGQSSNDVIPTAIHLSVLEQIRTRLMPALAELGGELSGKAAEFDAVLKIGRTHLQDATPIRLGQEFGGYAAQVQMNVERLESVAVRLGSLALGGTAVGTGINTHPEFAARVIAALSREVGWKLTEAGNHFAAQACLDPCVEAVALMKVIAVTLTKVANDIRWLASGPRCGLGELVLPPTQPGSSIMPGKVNPVMSEMLLQVCAQVFGCDAVVTFSGTYGAFELNTMLPVTAYNLLLAIELLSNGVTVFTRRAVAGLQADEAKCRANIEQSLAMCTALAPVIGYDAAAEIAKAAYDSGRTVREVALAKGVLDEQRLSELLDPRAQTGI